jgi:hypothetical protein
MQEIPTAHFFTEFAIGFFGDSEQAGVMVFKDNTLLIQIHYLAHSI